MPGLYCSSHRFTTCCFCLNLRTGCRLIGALTTFICSLELVSSGHKLIELLEQEKHCMDNLKWKNQTDKSYLSICSRIKVQQFMMIVNFIIFVVGFNGSILLLYGIKTKQPKLFLAWLVYSGLMIFSNFFAILIWHNSNILSHLFIVIVLSYFFRVVRSYHLQLYEEQNNGCPVVAVAFPQESGVRVFLPSQQPQTASDTIKDDPPPPYPGLPVGSSTGSIDSQPPPYSVVNPSYAGSLTPADSVYPSLPQVDMSHHSDENSRLEATNTCANKDDGNVGVGKEESETSFTDSNSEACSLLHNSTCHEQSNVDTGNVGAPLNSAVEGNSSSTVHSNSDTPSSSRCGGSEET